MQAARCCIVIFLRDALTLNGLAAQPEISHLWFTPETAKPLKTRGTQADHTLESRAGNACRCRCVVANKKRKCYTRSRGEQAASSI